MTEPQAGAPRRVVILGALSAIGEATARRLASKGAALALVARDAERLAAVADDLKLRGAANVVTHSVDLDAENDKRAALKNLSKSLGGLDAIILFYGVLGDQAEANEKVEALRRILNVNFLSAAEWMAAGAEILKSSPHKRPLLLAVSSVAGDRGRRSNYAYGAAKGGLAIFMQGLAHRLAAEGKTRAVVMKAGFVKSPMTAHLNPGGPLWADPDDIATAIDRAMERGGPVIYAPWYWRWIMLAIRATPAAIFNRVNL